MQTSKRSQANASLPSTTAPSAFAKLIRKLREQLLAERLDESPQLATDLV
jgi:hypothetical protein